MRILVGDVSDRGGIAWYTHQLVQALRCQGADVRLTAPVGHNDGAPPLPTHPWGDDVAGLSRAELYAVRLGEVPRGARALLAAVRQVDPDVVHLQTDIVPRLDWLALRAVGRMAPVVLTAHDPVPHEQGVAELARQARRWRAADAVIIHGEEPRSLVESCAPKTPIHVVPVDLRLGGPRLPRAEARARLGLGSEPIALLLGLLRRYKGLALLADAWPDVLRQQPDARLLVVGSTHDEPPGIDRLRTTAGVDVREGFVPEEDLDAWAAAADVLLLPYHHGVHSGVLHRALAAGTPTIVSPPLAEEALRTGAGIVVPLDPRRWATAVADALGPNPLPVPSPPTTNNTAKGTLAVYEQVLAARRGGR